LKIVRRRNFCGGLFLKNALWGRGEGGIRLPGKQHLSATELLRIFSEENPFLYKYFLNFC
jgi:hypothetical protein